MTVWKYTVYEYLNGTCREVYTTLFSGPPTLLDLMGSAGSGHVMSSCKNFKEELRNLWCVGCGSFYIESQSKQWGWTISLHEVQVKEPSTEEN